MADALNLSTLVPPRGERLILCGQTGSGKTTLAELLLRFRRYVVVYDAKGMLRWDGYAVYRSFDKLCKARESRLIYKPAWENQYDTNPDETEAFFTWVYMRRNTTCYVDELFSVCRGDIYPPHLGACLTRGRELGIELWSATQRPMRVPQVALSEAESTACFKLKMPQDRIRVESMTAIPASAIGALPKRQFYFMRQDGELEGPLSLSL